MAKRYSRRRSVRGRPNYCWITTSGIAPLASAGSAVCVYDNILIPSDWQSGNIVENETTLVHTVYTHAAYGSNATALIPFCGLYAIFKTNDQPPTVSPPNLGNVSYFPNFFQEYDECLHWGQYTAMPYTIPDGMGSAVWTAGGSSAALPENMVNLNSRRKLKGDDAIKVAWSVPLAIAQELYFMRWYARSLVRLGLK